VIFRPDGVISAFWTWAGQPSPQWLNEPRGLFQLALQPFGIVPPGWASGPSLALFCIAVMSVWYSQGFDTVVFLAGLTSIPRELYEAARLDGAGEWQVLRFLTWPLLLPTTFFILVISVIGSFKAFNQIYIMTGGGPSRYHDDGGPPGIQPGIPLWAPGLRLLAGVHSVRHHSGSHPCAVPRRRSVVRGLPVASTTAGAAHAGDTSRQYNATQPPLVADTAALPWH